MGTKQPTEKSSNHMSLWDSVQETNPKYTKTFKRAGGFSGTAVNATYVARRLTEAFGPAGIGWGVTIHEERILEGAPIRTQDGQVIAQTMIHVLRCGLWYELNGKKGEVQQFGQTTFVGQNKYGAFTDEEAPKKSLTDAMTKCASLLGVAADIHLGLYDDNKYVSDLLSKNNPPEGKKEPVWGGPLGKSEMTKAVRAFDVDLRACSDAAELIGLLEGSKPLIEQVERDRPSWWLGDGGDIKGMKERIADRKAELISSDKPSADNWRAWIEQMEVAIDGCSEVEHVFKVMGDHADQLKQLGEANRGALKFLENRAAAKRGNLSQSP